VTGLRAELAVGDPDACPVAAMSVDADGPLRDVRWTRESAETATERVVTVDDDAWSDAGDAESGGGVVPETVFDDGDERVVEFGRDRNGCVCERIESVGCPVDAVRAANGTLYVTVYVRSRERLREVVAAAREVAREVSLNYVVSEGSDPGDPVVVDRGLLTDRQREALSTAYEAGYFDHPREANAGAVAEKLDVSPATFREQVARAQSKLLAGVVEG
jgi:predicted DNA binding protein